MTVEGSGVRKEEVFSREGLLVITGPTASGKTDIAMRVAMDTGAEIVSADSIQIYRGLDIGAAKPSPEEQRKVVHHLVDVADPDESFSVARYRTMAEDAIEDIYRRGRKAVLTGGTGLYISAIIDEFAFRETVENTDIRQELESEAERYGLNALHARLAGMDPRSAERIHPHDRKRIIRALEICIATGTALPPLTPRGIGNTRYGATLIVLTMPREALYKRIDERVDMQVMSGLIEEVRSLLDAGIRRNALSMQGLGYKEIAGYIEGEYGLQYALDLLKKRTRNYARRQLIWWRRDPRAIWLDVSLFEDAGKAADRIEEIWLGSVCGK